MLPPPQVIRAVIQRHARLRNRYATALGHRPLVIPSAKFFPDPFRGDAESAMRLTMRMQAHAGMSDVPIRTALATLGPDGEVSPSSCSSGACGMPQSAGFGVLRVVDEGDGWLLQIPEPELRHPVALTTNLARSLAFVFLVETKLEEEVLEPPVDVTADFAAVALGFGALLLQGSYIYAKSCGGPRVTRVTKVLLPELAIATALFAATEGHELAPLLRELDPTQKELLSEAERLIRANRRLVSTLAERPDRIARGDFELETPSSILASLKRGFSAMTATSTPRSAPLPPIDPGLELDELESLLIAMPPASTVRGRTDRPPAPVEDELKELVAESLRSQPLA
jgi:hypothetical protein